MAAKAVEKVVILIGRADLVAHQVEEEVTIRRQRSKVEVHPIATYQ